MILGTGIDIVEIKRIENMIKRWKKNFLDHVFTKEEIVYSNKHKFPAQHFAARFAAKEAVVKALGKDFPSRWKDISITNDKYGKPLCEIKNKKFKHEIFISVSHTKTYAVASAIITKKSKRSQK